MRNKELYDNHNIESNDNVKNKEKRIDSNHFASKYRLKENVEYNVNAYSYEVDSSGRIKKCAGKLYLKEGKRNLDQQRQAGNKYRKETDDGGHIIAKRFNGSGRIDNIVAMDSSLNRGEYRKLENQWAKEIKNGNKVYVEIKLKYPRDNERPERITIKYRIEDKNGEVRNERRVFKN